MHQPIKKENRYIWKAVSIFMVQNITERGGKGMNKSWVILMRNASITPKLHQRREIKTKEREPRKQQVIIKRKRDTKLRKEFNETGS